MMNQGNRAIDQFERPLKDLRISVIDQCNFRCSYCMPAEIFGPDFRFLSNNELLSFDEIIRLTKFFVELGVEKIRLTGGEPLLRKDLDSLIKSLKNINGIKDIALTTNGVYLPKHAVKLKAAGLDRVNVSLDAIEDDVFKYINGKEVGTLPVIKGIDAAVSAGLKVKVNMVVKKGLNETQILPMAKFFRDKPVILRYIEFMDVGNTNGWDLKQVITKQEIIEMIHKEMPLEPIDANYFGEVASRYRYTGTEHEIGVISSVTDSFCSSCTRARLSADGKLFTCLFATEGHDLREVLRDGIQDSDLLKLISSIWLNRIDRYSDERIQNINSNTPKKKIEMSYIGG